jgi:hypothetical protein
MTSLPQDPSICIVDMSKAIGTKGETAIRIVVEKSGSAAITTAYPVNRMKGI